MVNLATYVMQFHERGGRDDWRNSFDAISDKILSQAAQMGCGDLVEKDPESGHWIPVEEYEQESYYKECADEFSENCFWEDLVARLSQRDIARICAPDQLFAMSKEDYEQRQFLREEIYWNEFEVRGVENLELINPAPHG